MRKKLWLIKRNETSGYDVNHAYVIRAKDEAEAREIAAENRRDEGQAVWQDPTLSTCEILTHNGETGVIVTEGRDG